jgi:uncharacterized protein YdeI (YjbR/CyaY-like superfamily)
MLNVLTVSIRQNIVRKARSPRREYLRGQRPFDLPPISRGPTSSLPLRTSNPAPSHSSCTALKPVSAMPTPKASSGDEFPTLPFPTAADFDAYLSANQSTAPGVYVKFAKKASGIPSIKPAEAVEVALCYGWIDGRSNSIDENWWTGRYTPRRAKSIWSQKNVATVGRLIEEGRMKDAGLKCVEDAKSDGRWERAYAGPSTIELAEDVLEALERESEAKQKFGSLKSGERYSVLWRIETASLKARVGVIERMVEMLAQGEVPDQSGSKKKPKAEVRVKGKVEGDRVEKKQTKNTNVVKRGVKAGKVMVDDKPRESRRAGLRSRG